MADPAPSQFIHDAAKRQLCQAYPYMKTEEVHKLAKGCKALIERGIEELQPAMEATKARISFMSLSPELRNRIYELALAPENGEAIYIGRHDGRGPRCGDPDEDEELLDCAICQYKLGVFSPITTQPPLTAISRQVRSEALPVYLGMNIFVSHPRSKETTEEGDLLDAKSFGQIRRWLKAMGKVNASRIRSLLIRLVNGYHSHTIWGEAMRWQKGPCHIEHGKEVETVLKLLRPEEYGLSAAAVDVLRVPCLWFR